GSRPLRERLVHQPAPAGGRRDRHRDPHRRARHDRHQRSVRLRLRPRLRAVALRGHPVRGALQRAGPQGLPGHRGSRPRAPGGGPLMSSQNILEVRGITSGYGEKTVVRNLSLTLPAGGSLAILGPNGAGKTTFLKTCSGLLKPTAGQILIDGKDVTKKST